MVVIEATWFLKYLFHQRNRFVKYKDFGKENDKSHLFISLSS